ncbi:Epsin-3, clathrin recruitment and traffic between the Golgi and endosome [Elasticomyces elasticus]|nr:Epsin-3, clathrin recruitment and traffic between the Golgi and endosome [Elasticomyces elasticus]
MDFASLKDQVSNLTLYDLKAGVRKVQNAVMNYTEMEAKLLNEIMPMIYKRFTEKSAEEWRQIYKALQLMEFLIKNGSERVIDDARSHLSLLKMLRQFHFIDQNGKDQGLNVRNRSKELADLLSDVDRIRAERKKARTTRNKYGGVEGGVGIGGSMSSSSRYGGFGGEDAGSGYGTHSGRVYGDGGGFGGNTDDFSESRSQSHGRERFEEYDEYDEGAAGTPGRRKGDAHQASSATKNAPKKPEPPKPKEPEIDLFSFGDDDLPTAPVSNGKQPTVPSIANDFGAPISSTVDDDDFDDFQSATPSMQVLQPPSTSSLAAHLPPTSTSTTTSATQFAAPQPRSGAQGANLSGLFSTVSPPPSNTATPSNASAFMSPPLMQQPRPAGYQAAQPNYFTSVSVQPTQSPSIGTPSIASKSMSKPKSAAGGDAFADLLAGTGIKKTGTPVNKGLTMADMAKQKASAGIWGTATSSSPAPSTAQSQAGGQKMGGALNDLIG